MTEKRKTIHVVLTTSLLTLLDVMAEEDKGEEAKADRSRVLRSLIRKDAERRMLRVKVEQIAPKRARKGAK